MNDTLVERFLRYAQTYSTSDEESEVTPSTPQQRVFAQALYQELLDLRLEEVYLDAQCYLYATLPASDGVGSEVPTIGFIAHLDTSPDASGEGVNPRIVTAYNGCDIVLNDASHVVLSPSQFPELTRHVGEDLIVTDGTTLLGADDKAGIAEIVTAVAYLQQHPEIRHGRIRIAFNPDEEIGRGASCFDVERFGCAFAYTIDGGEVGELEYENFNAAAATVTFRGLNVHPGTAKGKMRNASLMAADFLAALPAQERPEHTEGYEGFFHLTSMRGTVEEATLSFIVRDHDNERFAARKALLASLAERWNAEVPDCCTLTLRDQYYNMAAEITAANQRLSATGATLPNGQPFSLTGLALAAMEAAGVPPRIQPIRGGTDGAQLSFRGLPCPNLFAGGMNMHGRYEYVPIPSMHKAMHTILQICSIVCQSFLSH